jgi:glycosyltransferase involved in cell wall biosynthesis
MKMTQQRISVLHVIEGLGTGGAEQQLAAFLLRSNTQRFRHAVCTLAQVGRHAGNLGEAGIPVHTLSVQPDGDLARAVARIRHIVRAVDPDIIHSTLYRPTIVSRVVGRLYGKPVLTTLVNTVYEPEWCLDNPRLSVRKVWAVRTIDRLTARLWGSAYVAITESVKVSAIRRIGLQPEAITVIPRGIAFDDRAEPTSEDVRRARVALGLGRAYPMILNIGRLVPQKGQQYAVRAMRRVIKPFPSARLLVAGEGPLRGMLEELIRAEGLGGHVTLLGERTDADQLLLAADIFVFPSIFEGLGNALLEAMAAARPCVVSRIPALVEVTGGGRAAALAEARSTEDLASKLLQVAGDRNRAAQLGSAARLWVRSRYDLEKSVAALETLYERVAAPTTARVRAPHPMRA